MGSLFKINSPMIMTPKLLISLLLLRTPNMPIGLLLLRIITMKMLLHITYTNNKLDNNLIYLFT
jgi:hypothetical protein